VPWEESPDPDADKPLVMFDDNDEKPPSKDHYPPPDIRRGKDEDSE
jgi:hypothetical protein